MKYLGELVGPAVAREVLLEAQVFGAERARDLGVVNCVVPDDKVPEEVYATARRIADGAPLVHRWHKQFIRRLTEPQPLTEAEIAESYAAMGTEDYQIGVKAFLEKKRSEEHTSELQSLMRISYAVFCLKKKI